MSFLFHPWQIFFFGAMVSGGIFLWWILKKKQIRIFYPILRVLKTPKTIRMKFRVVPPEEWVPFLLFSLLALLLFILSFRPFYKIPKEDTQKIKTHILVDLSPSVSQFYDEESLREGLIRELDRYKEDELSWSTSETETIHTLEEPIPPKFWFHRSGLKMGSIVSKIFEKTPTIDRLLILSDDDFYTWSDLSSEAFSEEGKIIRLPLPGTARSSRNLFFGDITPASDGSSRWNILLRREGDEILPKEETLLSLSFPGEPSFWSMGVNFPLGSKELAFTAYIPEINGDGEILEWKIAPHEEDAIPTDNTFYTRRAQGYSSLTLYAPSEGEDFWGNEGAYQMGVLFESLGVSFLRKEQWLPSLAVKAQGVEIFFLSGGASTKVPDFETQKKTPYWFVPSGSKESYKALCLSALFQDRGACEEVLHRNHLIEILQSSGFSQWGGILGQKESAIAWIPPEEELRKSFFFTFPLYPHSQYLSYGTLPPLVETLWDEKGSGSWKTFPRIKDRPEIWGNIPPYENVPPGESLLKHLSREEHKVFSQAPPQSSFSTGTSFDLSVEGFFPFIFSLILAAFFWEALWFLKKTKQNT